MHFKQCIVVSFIVTATAKRKHFRKHQVYIAKHGTVSLTHFEMPGSEELFESLLNKEVELDWRLEGLDREYEKVDRIMSFTVGDENHRPGIHDYNQMKSWPIDVDSQIPTSLLKIKEAGGIRFCKELAELNPEHIPTPIISTYTAYAVLSAHCEEIYILMQRRRQACTKSLLEAYNPRRKWKLKAHHKAVLGCGA